MARREAIHGGERYHGTPYALPVYQVYQHQPVGILILVPESSQESSGKISRKRSSVATAPLPRHLVHSRDTSST